MTEYLTTVPVTIEADWTLFFNDVSKTTDPEVHMADLLSHGLSRGLITSYEILTTDSNGPFGLCYVYFRVKAEFTAEQLNAPKASAKILLDEVVRDNDVDVRWVGRSVDEDFAVADDEELVETSAIEAEIAAENKSFVRPHKDDQYVVDLVNYIKDVPGQKRADLIVNWLPKNFEAKDLTRLMEKARRRGLIVSTGKGRATAWYVVGNG